MQSDNVGYIKNLLFSYSFVNFNNQIKENMKKIVVTLFLVLFTSSVYAGSCPMMAKSLDDKIVEAQTLRDQGMAAHDAGDHAKSEELLGKAMELFKS
jgi:hypothetical protein